MPGNIRLDQRLCNGLSKLATLRRHLVNYSKIEVQDYKF